MKNLISFILVLSCIVALVGCRELTDHKTLPTDEVRDTIPNLTMATLISLVNMHGEELTWDDFAPYWRVDISSGPYALRYPINDTYFLRISGADTTQPPENIHLAAEQDPDIFIDVRTESIEEFMADGRASELAAKAKEKALNEAKKHYDGKYDYTNISYNIDGQEWYVEFWQNNAKYESQLIILDQIGTVTEILYKE